MIVQIVVVTPVTQHSLAIVESSLIAVVYLFLSPK